jgi:hypothetical protein
MAKDKKTITINDKEYTEEQLTDDQKVLINHITDLDRKIGSTQFNLDQLQVGRKAFMSLLEASLETEETEILAKIDDFIQKLALNLRKEK